MKVGLYSRVSTVEQVKEGYSIGEQNERMTKFCDAMNWNIYKIYTDGGYSGSNVERPALQDLIKDVQSHKIEKVLVYKIDRLSRSQLDTLYLIEKVFLANGVDFVSMSENFDTATPFGKAMIGILAVFAQLEREQIKERMYIGKQARMKSGKYNAGCMDPIGYNYIDGLLQVNEFEAVQIRIIYDYALQGLSSYRITKILNDGGYRHKHGKFNEVSIKNILTSKLYTGYVKFEGNWYKGIHEPIISEQQWNDVQKILKDRSDRYNHERMRTGKATTVLGGLIWCGRCGAKYEKNSSKKKRKDGSFYVYERYVCNSHSKKRSYLAKSESCDNKIWKIDELTDLVYDEIRKLKLEPDTEPDSGSDKKSDVLTSEIRKIEKQIEKLVDLYALDQVPVNVLQSKIQNLTDQKNALMKQLQPLQEPDYRKITDCITTFNDVLKYGTFEEIRTIIFELIERIVVNGDDITIFWKF